MKGLFYYLKWVWIKNINVTYRLILKKFCVITIIIIVDLSMHISSISFRAISTAILAFIRISKLPKIIIANEQKTGKNLTFQWMYETFQYH